MDGSPIYRDRTEAGQILAHHVIAKVPDVNPLVLALPRGGVPVAFEVARALRAELDVFLVRKLGLPGHEELAIGAIASGGVRVLNRELIEELHLSEDLINRVTATEEQELERRERLYRENRPALVVGGRTVILIDDGLATGASMMAGVRALRPQSPVRIVVAVPVAARETCQEFRAEADEVICPATPEPFSAVGAWYDDFSQTTDSEVHRLLEQAARERSSWSRGVIEPKP
ncbi:MAG: phosphoribosyltransferase [Bryobacteraceae bacterium]